MTGQEQKKSSIQKDKKEGIAGSGKPGDRRSRPQTFLGENRALIIGGLIAFIILMMILLSVAGRQDMPDGTGIKTGKKTEEEKGEQKKRPNHYQEAEEETESPFVSAETSTEKKEKKIREEDFYEALKEMGRKIHNSGLTYNGNAGYKTFEGARDFNCALYVSWTLQELKLLPSGKTFWFDDKGHGGGYQYMKEHDERFEIYHPNIPIHSSALLKPGDICGMKINGYAPHTAVFAGRDDKGHMLWYSAGRTDFRKMVKKDFKPIRFKYYEQNNDMLYTIARIRFEKEEE